MRQLDIEQAAPAGRPAGGDPRGMIGRLERGDWNELARYDLSNHRVGVASPWETALAISRAAGRCRGHRGPAMEVFAPQRSVKGGRMEGLRPYVTIAVVERRRATRGTDAAPLSGPTGGFSSKISKTRKILIRWSFSFFRRLALFPSGAVCYAAPKPGRALTVPGNLQSRERAGVSRGMRDRATSSRVGFPRWL